MNRVWVYLDRLTTVGVILMNKEMIISASGHETMAAILEDDAVVEIFVERDKSRGVAGNIYKGRVSKVLPGMQAAFVDLGLERDGFLYVSDVIDPVGAMDGFDSSDADGEDDGAGGEPVAADESVHSSDSGRGRSRTRRKRMLRAQNMCFNIRCVTFRGLCRWAMSASAAALCRAAADSSAHCRIIWPSAECCSTAGAVRMERA